MSRPDAAYWSPVDYGAGDATYAPSGAETAFCSNSVTDLGGGLYITECYGVTGWYMWLDIYSRQPIEDGSGGWKYSFACEGSEGSAFPERENIPRVPARALFGHRADTILAAPTDISDGSITVIVRSGDDYSTEKAVTIAVEQRPLG